MARAYPHALSALLAAAAAALGSGCATVPVAASAPRAIAPGSDWRTLPLAPFGSSLQELHLPLHEVLLFDDADAGPAQGAAQQRECYAAEGLRRRFAGRDTDSTLLCFRSGRLHSVEVSLQLPAGEAASLFAAYCDTWLQGAVSVVPRTDRACGGAAPGGPGFEAVLGEAEDGDGVPLRIVVHDITVDESP